MAAALTAIHAAGVVHRDLKPSNVLLSAFGPKVIDFGVAKARDATAHTEAGLVFGTLGWMAPEQLHGKATPASDVYVWGLLIAHAGTGWQPGSAAPGAGLGGLPRPLAELVAEALNPDPARRPAARDLLLRLCGSAAPAQVRTATAVLTRPWDPAYTQAPAAAQHPGAEGAAAARFPGAAPRAPQGAGTPPPHGAPSLPWLPARRPPVFRRPPAYRRQAPVPGRAPVAWRPRRWYRRKRVLILVILLAILAILNTDDGSGSGAALPPLTARDGILEFTATDVSCGNRSLGSGPLARRAQGQLCTIALRVRNFGDGTRRVHVSSQKLRDRDGRTFSADAGAWIYLPAAVPFRQEINPGNEISATLVYDIAADAVPAKLEVHDSPFSNGATITL